MNFGLNGLVVVPREELSNLCVPRFPLIYRAFKHDALEQHVETANYNTTVNCAI